MPKTLSPTGFLSEYNVKVYGAKGDGTTDDTAAVNAALNGASTGGGGVVLFPPGNYRITSSLQLPILSTGSLFVRGCGPGTTKITYSGTSFCFLIGNGGGSETWYNVIEDMEIISSGANPDGAVLLNKTQFCGIKRCRIVGFLKTGAIGIRSLSGVSNYFTLIDQVMFINVKKAIKLENYDAATSVGANANHIRQCWFGATADGSIHIDGGNNNTIEYCEFNGNSNTAIRISGSGGQGKCDDNKILNNNFDGSSTSINIEDSNVNRTFIVGLSPSYSITDNGSGTMIMTPAQFYRKNGILVGGANIDPGSIPLSIRGATAHTGNLLTIQDPTGATNYIRVDGAGHLGIKNNTVPNNGNVNTNEVKLWWDNTAGNAQVKARGKDSAGTLFDQVLSDMMVTRTAAPSDASISNGQCILWMDGTPGSAKLMIKGKNSSGTVVTGSINLT